MSPVCKLAGTKGKLGEFEAGVALDELFHAEIGRVDGERAVFAFGGDDVPTL